MLTVVGRVEVDREPHEQAATDHRPLVLVEADDDLTQPLERRLALELADHVPLGSGDLELRADRRRALRDARQRFDALEAQADGALLGHFVAVEQRAGAVEGSRARDTADHRHARRPVAQVGEDRVGRERVRVGHEHHPVGAGERGQALDDEAVVDRPRQRAERLRTAGIERQGEHGDRGAVLDLAAPAEHAAGAAADQAAGREGLVDALKRRLGRGQVRSGGEDDREVALVVADAGGGLGRRRDGALARIELRGQPGADADGHHPDHTPGVKAASIAAAGGGR